MKDFLIISLIVTIVLIWSWALVDLVRTDFSGKHTRLLCFFLILVVPVFGAIIYFQIKRYIGSSEGHINSRF